MIKHRDVRQKMIALCRRMNVEGLNTGSSGNLSVRTEDGFLITPSGIEYDALLEEQIVEMDMEGRYYGDYIPSSEWRFHYDILKARRDIDAVLHSHATHCAILACCRLDIPPIHYMIGVAGDSIVKCSGYAPFGTQTLSQEALSALGQRNACLLGNHGVITVGKSPEEAFHVLREVEHVARIYIGTRALGGVLLSQPEMDVVLRRFKSYGKQRGEIDLSQPDSVEPPTYGGDSRA